jgi:cytochrome c553
MQRSATIPLLLFLAFAPAIQAQELPTQEQLDFFETNIRPALSKYCYECHSKEGGKTRGGLLVDSKTGLAQGGDSGPAIVHGEPGNSLMWEAIRWSDPDLEMPPKTKMPPEVIENFRQWILMGAPDPRVSRDIIVESTIDLEEGRKHWAFQAPVKSAPPAVSDHSWARNEVDRFILAKLEEHKLSPSPDAAPATLLRRLNYDLIGLPPKPSELDAFLNSWKSDPDTAIATKVDELLALPQYGERWGRHWLDVARYAESTGKDVNFIYPHAWRYRDYVIDSFNADKPYDEFVREQISGDLLPTPSDDDWQENLIATGFLALGTKGLNEPNPRQFRMDVVDEQIDTMSKAFLGLTVSCARCHDHKTDPIPTADYYALAGILKSTETYYGTTSALQNKRPSNLLDLPLPDEVSASRTYSPREIEELEEKLAALRRGSSERRGPNGQASMNSQQNRMRTRAQISSITQILDSVNPDGTPISLAMGVLDVETPANANVLVRGETENPAQEIERGFLQVLNFSETTEIKEGQSGRRELAEWISSRDNPLTARVMVNRIWQRLFGEGLVSSANNWGTTGQAPSHPELLDYLALQFMESDWSVKSLIREIVLTRTYQLGSGYSPENFSSDPENRLHWRSTPRQLDAEALRDAMLLAGGNIEYQRPNASEVTQYSGGRASRQVDPSSFDRLTYRSVYLPLIRDMLPESLALFDFPDPSAPNPGRDETNMPSQALYLLNGAFVTKQAEAMADLLMKRFGDREQRIRSAFVLAYSRPATSDEVEGCTRYFQQFNSTASRTISDPKQVEQLATEAFCQALLSSAEFRILD